MKLNFYYFGDIGPFNEENPSYVLNQEAFCDVIYQLALHEPYTLNKDDLPHQIELDTMIDRLIHIQAIEEKDGFYKLNFSVFLDQDLLLITKALDHLSEIIGNQIITYKDRLYDKINQLAVSKNFSKERILYHIICEHLFDDQAFDYFKEKDVFLTSKTQVGNRDYLIFAYENSEMENEYSKHLLCSSNNVHTKQYSFNSFGDSNGDRKDAYRYTRLIQNSIKSCIPFASVNMAYTQLLDDYHQTLFTKCGDLLVRLVGKDLFYQDLNINEQQLIDFLQALEYVSIDHQMIHLDVPVFRRSELNPLKPLLKEILDEIYPMIQHFLFTFEQENKTFTPFKHGISIKEVGNELWHQIFGNINLYLMKQKFVETVTPINGEGRYLRSLYINV